MNICVCSNFKWYAYHLVDDNVKTMVACMGSFGTTGRLTEKEQQIMDTEADFRFDWTDTFSTLEIMKGYYA